MTLIESLPKTNDGSIKIPIGAIDNGKNIPGEVLASWVNNVFANYVGLTVPLNDVQYQGIQNVLPGNWTLNWQLFRSQGII